MYKNDMQNSETMQTRGSVRYKIKIQKFGTWIEIRTRIYFLPFGCSKSGIKFLSSQGNKTFKAKPKQNYVTQKLFPQCGEVRSWHCKWFHESAANGLHMNWKCKQPDFTLSEHVKTAWITDTGVLKNTMEFTASSAWH